MSTIEGVGLVALRNQIGDIVNRVQYTGERITVNKHNKAVAAIIPIEDLKLLEEIEDRIDAKSVDTMMDNLQDSDLIPWKDNNR